MVTTCLVASPARPALAIQEVFDSIQNSNVVKTLKEAKEQVKAALEQINLLKDQLNFLNDITSFINDVSQAIGEIATIEIPIPNLLQASSQLKSDFKCLMPDGPGWGIKFADLNLSSICETSSKYREELFVNQDKLKGAAFSESEAAWAKVVEKREALLEDTTVRALAQADVQMKKTEDLGKTADDLQKELAKAKTLQQRQHITAQIQLLQTQAIIAQNQMMAQQLKLSSIAEIKKGLPPNKVQAATGVVDEGGN